MAAPAAKTESAGAKIMPLSDSTTTTSIGRVPVSITKANQSAGGDSTNAPVGWLGVGTHNDADTILGPGGFTVPIGSGPIVLLGGADGTSGTEGSRVIRPVRLHEGGANYVLPGGSYTSAAAYQAPLKATGGAVLLTAAGANQAFSVALASNFAYLTDLYLLRTDATAIIPANSEVRIMDATGGTVMLTLLYPAAGKTNAAANPGLEFYAYHFSNPPRTSVVNGQFFATTVGAGLTWSIACNGYYSTGV